MEGEHALGLHQFHIAQRVVVIRVIAERERRIALVAEGRAGIESPAGEHGGPAILDACEHERAVRTRWADEHFAPDFARRVAHIAGGKAGTQFPVDLRHPEYGAVEHRGEAGGEQRTQNLL